MSLQVKYFWVLDCELAKTNITLNLNIYFKQQNFSDITKEWPPKPISYPYFWAWTTNQIHQQKYDESAFEYFKMSFRS